jgi:hypothetical protein
MRDDERVVAVRFEHDAIAVVIQHQAGILGDQADPSRVAAIRARVGGRVSGESRIRQFERCRVRVTAPRRAQQRQHLERDRPWVGQTVDEHDGADPVVEVAEDRCGIADHAPVVADVGVSVDG